MRVAFSVCLALLAAAATSALQAQTAEGLDWATIIDRVPFDAFEPVDPERRIAFPADHGTHAGSPADAWTLAAHLETENGEEVGVQMSLARVAIVAPDAPPAASAWQVREIWRGHATLVRAGAPAAIGEERIRRGFAEIAAYDEEDRELRLDDWSLRFAEAAGDQALHIVASIGSTASVSLTLVPEKPVITPAPESAVPPFLGYALPRLRAEGTLTTADGPESISGVAWFEHFWGDLPFPGGPTATDRLILQVDDGTDISITRTRRRDGVGAPRLAGIVILPDGSVEPLPEDATLTADATWRPGPGAADYPVRWTLVQDGMELRIVPVAEDQRHRFLAPVWSGMVVAEGTSASGDVSAVGTLQLHGYED